MAGIVFVPDGADTRYALQLKARHEMILKLQEDILADMMVCKFEGWNQLEYIEQLQDLLNSFK